MKKLKLCYFACLVFAFFSLDKLAEESNEVIYEKSNQTEPVEYLACKRLEYFYHRKTEVDLNEFRDHLNEHLNRSEGNGWWQWIQPTKVEALELVRKGLESKSYLLLNGRVCFIASTTYDANTIGSTILPDYLPEYFAFKRDTLDFTKMSGWHNSIEQLTVLKKRPPYSDCSESNSRFRCLHECFKRRFNLSRYFYQGNESALVQLNYNRRNRTIEESQMSCFRSCKRENCKLIQLIAVDTSAHVKGETFEARPKLTAFDYWLQFIGLLCSSANISLNEFALVAIEFLQSRMSRRSVKIALVCLKFTIILLGLASFGYLCTQVALDHKTEENHPLEGTRHLMRPKTVRLAICLHIFLDIWMHENSTMWEIERTTDWSLGNEPEGIYVDCGGTLLRTNYKIHRKVLFKHSRRCFLFSIYPNCPTTLTHPKLMINFTETVHAQLYLLSENENLSSETFFYSDEYAFRTRIVDRSRSDKKCVDYEKKYANCTGRQNCVERCIGRKFMNAFNATIIRLANRVVDRDWFSSAEWSTSSPMKKSEQNSKIYEEIAEECSQKILNEKACLETMFETTVHIRKPNDRAPVIDLQFDVVRFVFEGSSWYKLVLNIVTIETLVFGLTALSILQTIGSFVQTIWKESKLVIFLVYLLCSFGASWHTYHILHLVIINGELVPTQHYELLKRIRMPEMMFCLQIDQNLIDEHHQLTGNYLEQLTSQMTPGGTFANITYLNESNEWTPFDLHRVEPFFFLNMKCFKIDLDQEYDRDQFHFSTSTQVLRLNFTHKRNEEGIFINFLTKSKETAELSKIVEVKYSWFARFSIAHESSLYKYEDRFSFIRRHFLREDEASDSYSDLQLLELLSNEHNLRTLNLPLEKHQFGVEIREDLFEQLYSVRDAENQNKRTDSNYEQLFVDNHLRGTWASELAPDLTISLAFLQKVVTSTNELNLGKLILSLLNVLFIWFDLGVLDLHLLFVHLVLDLPVRLLGQTNRLLLFVRKWLKKLESPLYEHLKPPVRPQQQNLESIRRSRRF